MSTTSTTSYAGLYRDRGHGGSGVRTIQIPMIQRDYAQGRRDTKTKRIRSEFLAALARAVEPGAPTLGLDFVYGDVRDGVLVPLDGQQRLTALFLLHWYLAVRAGGTDAPWLCFTYETRASARQFCEELRKVASAATPRGCPSDFDDHTPAAWITDQPWFMPGWTSEPTIFSMLVVLDDLHALLGRVDARAALSRLTDRDQPAIDFHVLDLEDMNLDDGIYVRMNSRGKPLTDFEIFKARFGARLEKLDHDRAREFAQRIDGAWLDIFWNALASPDGQPGADGEIDAAILRYMRFLADFADARETGSIAADEGDAEVCLRVFGKDDEGSATRLDWLFHGFDIWVRIPDISDWFAALFRDGKEAAPEGDVRLPLFDLRHGYATNLFLACCRHYSPDRYQADFPARLALLLHAVVFSECADDDEARERLRTIRNLADWSNDEIRPDNMKPLILQTEAIVSGSWLESAGFNAAQREDERRKSELLDQVPSLTASLNALEDHRLLRGRLLAFALDPQTFPAQAEGVLRDFGPDMDHDAVAAALLAADDYTDRGNVVRRFVTTKVRDLRWREVLTSALRGKAESPIALALHAVLECPPGPGTKLGETLRETIIRPFLDRRSAAKWFDWRYYFLAYPPMRASAQGCYSPALVNGAHLMGYVVRRHHNLDAAIRDTDPYLEAICGRLGEDLRDRLSPEPAGKDYHGQSLNFRDIGISLTSRQDGWGVHLSGAQAANAAIVSVFEKFGLIRFAADDEAGTASFGETWHYPIAQTDRVPDSILAPGPRDVTLVDCEDRIGLAADFITALDVVRLKLQAGHGAGKTVE